MTRSHVDGFIAQFIRASYVSEMERSWVRILINYKVALKLFSSGLHTRWLILRVKIQCMMTVSP